MAMRDDKGRYLKGVSGNPGGRVAPDVDSAKMLRDALSRKLTEDEAEAIIARMVHDAKRGDHKAREHVFAMVGIDVKRITLNNKGAVKITVEYVRNNPDPA